MSMIMRFLTLPGRLSNSGVLLEPSFLREISGLFAGELCRFEGSGLLADFGLSFLAKNPEIPAAILQEKMLPGLAIAGASTCSIICAF